jgi:inosine-uridine nucleoside N-ribohydrolase
MKPMTTKNRIRPRVVIDCDPGQDDVLAIALAAQHCDVVGITTVAGNSPLHNTVRNARIACDLFGLDHVPVHAGATQPLAGQSLEFATDVHGRTGLDGPATREPSRPPDGDDAVSFLIETLLREDGIWLIATGPMTNIALALQRCPDLLSRIAGMSFMGGSTTHGNVTVMGEFNMVFDPEAADYVLTHATLPEHASIRMSGLDLTHQITGDHQMIGRLRAHGSASSMFCAELQEHYLQFYVDLLNQEREAIHFPLHDPCAVLAVTHPELFTFEVAQVSVETSGVYTRGMTVIERRPWKTGAGNVHIATNPSVDTARQLIEAALLR